MFWRSLGGDDIFVSYSRADATTYADGLANELTRQGFSCFTDRLGTDAHQGLPPMLLDRLRSCSMLVVLCTDKAAGSPFVAQEVHEFVRIHGTRRVVPVVFGSADRKARWFSVLGGMRREIEKESALATGDPSPAVVSRIEKAFVYARAKERLQRYTRAAVALLVVLLLASTAASVYAVIQVRRAEQARVEADARRLANRSEALRSETPANHELSTLLAAESLRRFRTVEADQALRRGLALSPRAVARMGHEAPLRPGFQSFSPDGKYLAAIGGNAILIWLSSRGGPPVTRLAHRTALIDFTFCPDGGCIVTSEGDGSVHLWRDWHTPRPREAAPPLHLPSGVAELVISPRGRYLATLDRDRIVRVWESWASAARRNLWSSEKPHSDQEKFLSSIAFSADEKFLVGEVPLMGVRKWRSDDGTEVQRPQNSPLAGWLTAERQFEIRPDETGAVSILRVSDGRPVARLSGLESLTDLDTIHKTTFDAQRGYLGLAGKDQVFVIDTTGSRLLARIPVASSPRMDIAFRPDQPQIAIAAGGTVSLWEFTGEVASFTSQREVLRIVPASADVITFSPDGRYIATLGENAQVWSTSGYPEAARFGDFSGYAMARVLAFSPGGRHLALDDTNELSVWDIGGSPRAISRVLLESYSQQIAFSEDGRYLASATGAVEVFERWWTQSPREVSRVDCKSVVQCLAISHDGRYMATGARTMQIWSNWQSGHPRLAATLPAGKVEAVAFSPDDRYLLTGSHEGTLQAWSGWSSEHPQASTLFPRGPTQGERPQNITSLAVSRNGESLAAATPAAVWVWRHWQSADRAEVLRIPGGSQVALSPGGGFLAVASGNSAAIWNLTSRREIAQMVDHEKIWALAMSPDGKYLATGSNDGTVRLWLWRRDDLLRETCRRLRRDITEEEWQQLGIEGPPPQTCEPYLREDRSLRQ
jgi:WD40 repeat protein